MASRISWSTLYPGLIALVVIIALAFGVLRYGAVGRVRGDKVRLHVVTDQARGVMRGTEVWLDGQRVGLVEDVGFRPPGTDTMQRLVIGMVVRADAADRIRRDSDARVRAGANLIGPIVVYITAGTPASPPIREGDTLVAAPQSDAQHALTSLARASEELPGLMADARVLASHVRDRRGTMGALLAQRDGAPSQDLGESIRALRAAVGTSAGARDAMLAATRSALARADSVRALLASRETSLGRFRRDTTLARTIASVRDELAALRARADTSHGTLQRLASDSAIALALADAQRAMALLFEDVRKRPLRYITF